MKKNHTYYWAFTILLAIFMTVSAVPDILRLPDAQAFFRHLGYPVYLLSFLGIAKLLGVIALFIPGQPRIREWVYAGFVFNLSGAMYSGIATGDTIIAILPVLAGLVLAFGSYLFYHKKSKSAAIS